MRRRKFISLIGAAAAWPLATRAQQLMRIGVLLAYVEGDREANNRIAAMRAGLREAGWIENQNLQIDIRYAPGQTDRVHVEATALVRSAPDVIWTNGTPMTEALKAATQTIPVVFTNVVDPVGSRLVSSLAKPGGNLTGFTNYESTIGGKWAEVLKELVPSLNRILIIHNPDNLSASGLIRSVEAAAATLGVRAIAAPVRNIGEVRQAIELLATEPNGGFIALPDGRTNTLRGEMLSLALRHSLPAIYPFQFITQEGGMISYGMDSVAAVRQAASHVDRILKGAKPADMPVQNPTKFEMAINLKTAKSIGLTIPESFLLRADEVIE